MPVGYIHTVMCLPPPLPGKPQKQVNISLQHLSYMRVQRQVRSRIQRRSRRHGSYQRQLRQKRAYAETKHGDKTIKIRINKLGATTVQKRIDKCKCDFCKQEFVMAEELRRHIVNRPPTCRPPPPSKFMPVDAPSEVTKHPERNWILFRKQAYTRARNMKNYEEWRCITTVYQGCAGGLKISKNRVTQFRPCNIDHHEYNLNSTGTQNCQRIGLVSDFLLYPMPTFSLL